MWQRAIKCCTVCAMLFVSLCFAILSSWASSVQTHKTIFKSCCPHPCEGLSMCAVAFHSEVLCHMCNMAGKCRNYVLHAGMYRNVGVWHCAIPVLMQPLEACLACSCPYRSHCRRLNTLALVRMVGVAPAAR